jgi:hypothetical protein
VILVWLVIKNDSTPANQTATTQQTQSFFPVGALKEIVSQVTNIGDQLTETVQDLGFGEDEPAEQGPFMKISDEPVADYGFINLNGTSTLFFVDQASGNFYLYQNGEKSRLTNKTIPRIKGVAVAGNKIVLKTLNEDGGLIFYLTQISSTSSPELSLKELESNIIEIIASPDQKQFFKLLQLDNGVVGYLTDLNLKNKTKVFESPLSEWVIDWPSLNFITTTSKPSSGISGSSYLIDTKTGKSRTLISNQPGLMVKAYSIDKMLFSTNQNNKTSSFTKNKDVITNINLKTLADKCTWDKNGIYATCAVPNSLTGTIPDDWYQGRISFNDSFWDISPTSGEVYSLFEDLNKKSPKIDAFNLKEDGNLIYFTNKLDGSLWVLNP